MTACTPLSLQAELDTRAEQVAALTNQLQSLQAQVGVHGTPVAPIWYAQCNEPVPFLTIVTAVRAVVDVPLYFLNYSILSGPDTLLPV
jgi:hypothetical protein